MIDDLIIRSLQGEASPPEEERLRMWRRRSSENETRYRRLREIWVLAGVRATNPVIPALPDPGALIERAEAAEWQSTAASGQGRVLRAVPTPRPLSSWASISRRAAAGLLAASLAALGFGLGNFAFERSNLVEGVAYGEIVTGPGEMATFTLADGTAIRVGPESTLRLLTDSGDPVVWLDGLAFFGIHPDPTRRFTVRTPHGEATALGTRFEVRSEEQDFRVVVVEGTVRVSAAGVAVELPGGLMSESRGGAPLTSSRVEDVEQLLGWMGRTLMFHDTPVATVVAEIESRYGLEIVVEDERFLSLTVTATLIDRPIEAVFAILCESIGAECSLDRGRVRIGAPTGAFRTPARPPQPLISR